MSFVIRIGPATTSTKGTVKLAGDLGGTADLPVVQNVARANGGGLESVVNLTASGANTTLNLGSGNVFNVRMSANTTFAFSGATTGKACSFSLYLTQDGTGGRTVSWPSGVLWSGGAPTVSSNANAVDVFVFETINGGSTWFGSLVGTNFS
jgi:hypothetical protein